MHDAKGKIRDLRRGYYSRSGFQIGDQFDAENPELGIIPWEDHASWYNYHNRRDQWIKDRIGARYEYGRGGSISSSYRRSRNKTQRTREKQIMRELFRDGELDIVLPQYPHNLRYDLN